MSIARNSVLAVALLVALPPLASSQTLGTFRWQMRTYCNLLTLTVTRSAVFIGWRAPTTSAAPAATGPRWEDWHS